MFDDLPSTTQPPAQSDPRLLALQFLATAGTRLARAAQRIGGEAGATLTHALGDMMIDRTVDPMHWPIDAMVSMLHRPSAGQDAEVDRLESLSYLRSRIDDGLT